MTMEKKKKKIVMGFAVLVPLERMFVGPTSSGLLLFFLFFFFFLMSADRIGQTRFARNEFLIAM